MILCKITFKTSWTLINNVSIFSHFRTLISPSYFKYTHKLIEMFGISLKMPHHLQNTASSSSEIIVWFLKLFGWSCNNMWADLWQPAWLQLFGYSTLQANVTIYVYTPKKYLINKVKHVKRFFLWWSDYSQLQYLYGPVKGPSVIHIKKIKASHKSEGKGKTFILIVILSTIPTGICHPSCTLSNMQL